MSPFSAEIWGTVSDWVMIVVTLATGILIWLTLRSQMVVQKLQEENFKVEKERVRLEFHPKFLCDGIDISHNHRDGEFTSVIKASFRLKSKDCKEVKIVANNFISIGIMLDIIPKSRDYLYAEQQIEITNIARHSSDLYPVEGTHFQLTFEYQDLIGHMYLQQFQWAYMGEVLEAYHLPPVLITTPEVT